jgi:hypothetical protein
MELFHVPCVQRDSSRSQSAAAQGTQIDAASMFSRYQKTAQTLVSCV